MFRRHVILQKRMPRLEHAFAEVNRWHDNNRNAMPLNAGSPFSPESYRGLVQTLVGAGYSVRDYVDHDPGAAHLILRHDVDMSLDAAVALAEIECDMGVAATYFVLVRSELYNPAAAAGQAALRRLLDLGQRVGLHFDAALYGPDESLDDAVARECQVLEWLTGRSVDMVSFHRPVKSLLGRPGRLGGRLHTYAPEFFSAIGYCSDSRGAWHHGAPLDHAAVAERRALQLLTHPIWWMSGEGTPRQRLDAFLARRESFVRSELASQCDVYAVATENA